MNAESELLAKLVPGAVELSGSDDDDRKEEIFEAFRHGQIKKLVTKPKIAAFGMNWQHCHHMTYFPDHSFEQYYQSVRRFWRFGQKHAVRVDTITSQSNMGVSRNLKRKAQAGLIVGHKPPGSQWQFDRESIDAFFTPPISKAAFDIIRSLRK